MKIQPVILCGGHGRRLWPLSRADHAKPFLQLGDQETLFSQTLARIRDNDLFADPIVICGQEQVEDVQNTPHDGMTVIVEPEGRNTAPALAAACAMLADKGQPVLMMPADHKIDPAESFRQDIQNAFQICMGGNFVLFGIKPQSPASKFGYIVPSDTSGDEPTPVKTFVEKPDTDTARDLIENRNALWNSGIFLMRAIDYLDALGQNHDDMIENVENAWNGRKELSPNTWLLGDAFKDCTNISIDYAVMQDADNAVVFPTNFSWSDMGSWHALWQSAEKDSSGTAATGPAIATNCKNAYLNSQGPLVCAVDVHDLAIVATKDAVIVTPLENSDNLRDALDNIEKQNQNILLHSPFKSRDWGTKTTLETTASHRIYKYIINAGAMINEDVKGQCLVITGEAVVEQTTYKSGDSFIVDDAQSFTLQNKTDSTLEIVVIDRTNV